MNRIRKTALAATQRINHRLNRKLTRSCLRRAISGRQGPDELSRALTAFSRVIRSHRRLAKLAPRFFDPSVVDQEIRDRAEWIRRRPVILAALDKVYGPDPDAKSHALSDELPPLPSIRTQSVVERELAACELWMVIGKRAMTNYFQRHSQRVPSLTRIARLSNVATRLGRMACGLDSIQSMPSPLNYDSVWADLERAYPATVLTSEGGDTF